MKSLSLPATVPTADRADPVLDRLKHLHPKVIDLSLGRTFRMLEAIGSPHKSLPPVVHVAGTPFVCESGQAVALGTAVVTLNPAMNSGMGR